MPANVLIFGDRLHTDKWDKIKSDQKGSYDRITLCSDPRIPNTGASEGTAYVDLDQGKFFSPEFMAQLIQAFDRLKIIGVSDSADDSKTLQAAKMGVSEILTEKDYLDRIGSFIKPVESDKPAQKASDKPVNQYDISAIIGSSPRISKIKKMITHLKDVDFPNAILFGETGTGKDLLAKVLHYSGVRKDNHFIEVNCSAIPDELFESELFGHKKGAFTDAKSDKTGLFEFADNGTIFLDEIGNLTPSSQAKLLKILESRKLRPLGAVEDKDVNVRVLAATNIDLNKAVEGGGFREDLLFRLNLIAIHLPPLRERKEDINELAQTNFKYYCTLYNKELKPLSKEALKALERHEWPGNVRELRNVMERTVLLSTSKSVHPDQIADAIANGRVTARERRSITLEIPETGLSLEEIERKVVGEILNMADWNKTEAAKILGISRARLRRIMDNNKLQKNRRSSKKSGTK